MWARNAAVPPPHRSHPTTNDRSLARSLGPFSFAYPSELVPRSSTTYHQCGGGLRQISKDKEMK